MGFTAALARASMRRPWLVLVAWTAAVAASAGALVLLHSPLTTKVGAAGTESARAKQIVSTRIPGTGPRDAVLPPDFAPPRITLLPEVTEFD